MKIRKLLLLGTFSLAIIGSTVFAIAISYIAYPTNSPQPLPNSLRPQVKELSNEFLTTNIYTRDYSKLLGSFEPQIYRSYCGVASSATVLNALGKSVSQESFFANEKANKQSHSISVYFAGMTLTDFANLLTAYGAKTKVHYASKLDVNRFRDILKNNMNDPGNYLVVNYLRSVLGQENIGHISPVGAYNPDTDEVLIMDVTTYNYPHVWVKLTLLFDAMNTKDNKQTRGFVEVF